MDGFQYTRLHSYSDSSEYLPLLCAKHVLALYVNYASLALANQSYCATAYTFT